MSWLTVSTLRKTVKTVTRQERLWLPQESFRLKNVEISIENESSIIDFHQYDEWYKIGVLDKQLQRSVSLNFWIDSEVSVSIFFYKKRRTRPFWKKPSLQIVKSMHMDIDDQDEENNENIKFVWDRIPEFLINLR